MVILLGAWGISHPIFVQIYKKYAKIYYFRALSHKKQEPGIGCQTLVA
jgi:hypothetical protein